MSACRAGNSCLRRRKPKNRESERERKRARERGGGRQRERERERVSALVLRRHHAHNAGTSNATQTCVLQETNRQGKGRNSLEPTPQTLPETHPQPSSLSLHQPGPSAWRATSSGVCPSSRLRCLPGQTQSKAPLGILALSLHVCCVVTPTRSIADLAVAGDFFKTLLGSMSRVFLQLTSGHLFLRLKHEKH